MKTGLLSFMTSFVILVKLLSFDVIVAWIKMRKELKILIIFINHLNHYIRVLEPRCCISFRQVLKMQSVDDNYSVERRSYRAVEDRDFDHLFDCVLPSIIVGDGSVEVNNERDAWFSFCRQTKAPCLHLREEGATAIIRGTTSCNKFSFSS